MLHVNNAREPHVNQDSHTECCTLINRVLELQVNQDFHNEFCMLINHVWEPQVNQDLFISHTVSQRESSKFHLKIPACESQHCLQSNLSQTHLYHGVKRPNKQRNSNLWEASFLLSSCCEQATAGMLRAFPVYFVPLQSNSIQYNMHSSHVATENCMKCGLSHETDCWGNYCVERFY